MKDNIVKVLYAFILSVALFMLSLPELKPYLLLVDAVFCYALAAYGFGKGAGRKNHKFFAVLLSILLGNTAAYAVMKYFKGARLLDGIELAGLAVLAAALLLAAYYAREPKEKRGEKKSEKEAQASGETDEGGNPLEESLTADLEALSKDPDAEKLYAYRYYDMERLIKLFCRVPVIGIDAEWGNGKSYLINRFCNLPTIRTRYDVIRIDLLACNYDEVEKNLFRKLDELFKKHRVFSSASQSLQKAFKASSAANLLYEFFFRPHEGYTATFEGLNEDIGGLDKGIIIVYDDIDRINEPKIIKKIFGISEKLASYGSDVHDGAAKGTDFAAQDKVHVFYLFDRNELTKQKFERAYLEKYIPFTLKLTDMELEPVLGELWKSGNYDGLGIAQKEIKNALEVRVEESLKKLFGFSGGTVSQHTTIRKAEIFLRDIQNCMKSGIGGVAAAGLDEEEYAKLIHRIIIVFCYIKNYCYSIYELLDQNIGEPLTNILTFFVDEQEMTIQEAVIKASKEKKGPSQPELSDFAKVIRDGRGPLLSNAESLAFLSLFQYPIDMPERDEEDTEESRSRRGLVLQPELPLDQLMKNEDKRSRIDHLVANLLQNGRSERTDLQVAVERFCTEVLPQRERWEEAWNAYQEKYYNEKDGYKDNKTVFPLMGDRFLRLFQGFYIYRRSTEEWCGLLDCYAAVGENQIDAEFIQNLYYCDVQRQEVYLKALEIFCRAKVIGNLNHVKDYKKFLQKYLKQVFYFGYSNNRVFEPYEIETIVFLDKDAKYAINELHHMTRAIRNAQKTAIPQINKELRLIKRFIVRNIMIIRNKQNIFNRALTANVSFNSRTPHQEKVDEFLSRLKDAESKEDLDRLKDDIEEAYQRRELYPIEVNRIMEEYGKKTGGD